MFFAGSRYEHVPTREIELADGRTVQYKATRLIVPPALVRTRHLVGDEDRLDLIAHRHLRDSERFWRICDANAAMRPADLTAEAGRWLDIPPPGA